MYNFGQKEYLLTPRQLYQKGITTREKAKEQGVLGVWDAWNLDEKILVYPGVPTIPVTMEQPRLTTPTFTTFPVPPLTTYYLPPAEEAPKKGILDIIPWKWIGLGLLVYFLIKK